MLSDAIEKIKEARVPLTLHLSGNRIGGAGAGLLAEAIKVARVPLTLGLSYNNIGAAGAGLLAEAIKEALVPLTLNLGHNNIGEAGVGSIAEAIKVARVPLTLDLSNNCIGVAGAGLLAEAIKVARALLILDLSRNNIGNAGAGLLAEAIKEARVPLTLDLTDNYISASGTRFLADAQEGNFIIDARSDPSKFLSCIGFSLSMRMIEQELSCPSVVAKLVQNYISEDDLAWIEVAAIRAVENASHENKYSSINYALLNAAYFVGQRVLDRAPRQSAYNGQEKQEGNHSSSSKAVVTDEDDGGSPEDGVVSSSSSSSGSHPHGGGAIDSVELSDQEADLSGNAQPINHEHKQASQQDNDNGDVPAAETLLKTLFAWIKDLPEDQQQKLLSSFSMQQVLEFLDETANLHKFIADQLTSKPIEEIFAAECQKHYSLDDLSNDQAQYAQINQFDHPTLTRDYGEVIASDGVFIDPLPKHDINFGAQYLFGSLINELISA